MHPLCHTSCVTDYPPTYTRITRYPLYRRLPILYILLLCVIFVKSVLLMYVCLTVYVDANLSDITLNFPIVFSNFRSSLPIQGDLYRAGKM